MMRTIILRTPLKLTATASYCLNFQVNTTPANINVPIIRRYPQLSSNSAKRFFSDKTETPNSPPPPPPTQVSELTRVDSLVNGCDYNHWLVVMDPPEGYPSRDQVTQHYVRTLAGALGSEEAAKRSIYSVSTKYYYAFSCKLPENMIHKIKSLPKVRWILPDCYMPPGENDYGGEPFVNGEIVPYHDKYHKDWLPSENTNTCAKITRSRKARKGKRKRTTNSDEMSG